jgi:hypothetical protein
VNSTACRDLICLSLGLVWLGAGCSGVVTFSHSSHSSWQSSSKTTSTAKKTTAPKQSNRATPQRARYANRSGAIAPPPSQPQGQPNRPRDIPYWQRLKGAKPITLDQSGVVLHEGSYTATNTPIYKISCNRYPGYLMGDARAIITIDTPTKVESLMQSDSNAVSRPSAYLVGPLGSEGKPRCWSGVGRRGDDGAVEIKEAGRYALFIGKYMHHTPHNRKLFGKRFSKKAGYALALYPSTVTPPANLVVGKDLHRGLNARSLGKVLPFAKLTTKNLSARAGRHTFEKMGADPIYTRWNKAERGTNHRVVANLFRKVPPYLWVYGAADIQTPQSRRRQRVRSWIRPGEPLLVLYGGHTPGREIHVATMDGIEFRLPAKAVSLTPPESGVSLVKKARPYFTKREKVDGVIIPSGRHLVSVGFEHKLFEKWVKLVTKYDHCVSRYFDKKWGKRGSAYNYRLNSYRGGRLVSTKNYGELLKKRARRKCGEKGVVKRLKRMDKTARSLDLGLRQKLLDELVTLVPQV